MGPLTHPAVVAVGSAKGLLDWGRGSVVIITHLFYLKILVIHEIKKRKGRKS